jgi:hypothetical protein
VAVQLPPTDQSPTMGMVALLPKNGTETSALVIEFVFASWTGLAEVEAEQLRNLGRQTAQPPRLPRPRIYCVVLSAETCTFKHHKRRLYHRQPENILTASHSFGALPSPCRIL